MRAEPVASQAGRRESLECTVWREPPDPRLTHINLCQHGSCEVRRLASAYMHKHIQVLNLSHDYIAVPCLPLVLCCASTLMNLLRWALHALNHDGLGYGE